MTKFSVKSSVSFYNRAFTALSCGICAVTIFLTCIIPITAHAAAGEWQHGDVTSARMVSGVDGTGNGTTIPLGIEVQLNDGWHTYWRSPGEAGLPPQLDWKNSLNDSGNLKNATLLYPAPHRYSALGMETIGYIGGVIFPIDAELREAGKPLVVDATLDLLVCRDLCVPQHFRFNLTVPAGSSVPSAEAPALDDARAHVPKSESDITVTSTERAPDHIKIAVASREPFTDPDIFTENDKSVSFAAPLVEMNADKTAATFTLNLSDKLPDGVTLETLPLTVTIVDGDQALGRNLDTAPLTPTPLPPLQATGGEGLDRSNVKNSPQHMLGGSPSPLLEGERGWGEGDITTQQTFWFILLLAVLGGFILNLMPCVLPVLSLKIVSVTSHGGGLSRTVRRSFIATAAGIIVSFLALAAVTIALRETGQAIGWGAQFQQPLFIAFLLVVITLFAANLWGLFEIPLPRFIADRLDPLYHPKLAGDFATGILATLLATPCSAPFLGTAVGFALASGVPEIIGVFAALGFGMALPYLAVALFPRMAIALPRPGAWMLKLRRLLGWAMALTAVWLLWILAAEVSRAVVIAISFALIAIVGALYVKRHKRLERVHNYTLLPLALLTLGLAAFSDAPSASPIKSDSSWQKFDEAAISRYVSEGKTVFLDVTADWCLTCKANKKFTLGRDDISSRLFHSPDIIAMQADWTNPNPDLLAFLQRSGRYGIPFNAVYGPDAPHGIVLPEILTPSIVMDALDNAGKTHDKIGAKQ